MMHSHAPIQSRRATSDIACLRKDSEHVCAEGFARPGQILNKFTEKGCEGFALINFLIQAEWEMCLQKIHKNT